MSALIAPTNNVNGNLKLPIITPNWINTAIGLLFSTQTYEWTTSTVQNIQFSAMNFNIPTSDESKESDEQSIYILEQILVPLLDCKIIGYKVYECQSCKNEIKIRSIFTYILVNVNKTDLHIERELHTFFGPMTSDLLCSVCSKPTICHIEVIQWPQVLIINVIDAKATFHYRKPPGVISLSLSIL
jgi:hypothetical protein